MSILTGLGSFALAHAGMVGLALAMDRHRRQLRPVTTAAATLRWRIAGGALLALSLRLSMQTWGASAGLVAWFGVAAAAALALILLLTQAPVTAWRTGWLAGAAGLTVVLFA